MEHKEKELIDYIRVLIRKKFIIIIGTSLSILMAAAVGLILKRVYEIDAIIQPGKFFIQRPDGTLEQFIVEEPKQIADKVKRRTYDSQIAMELKLDPGKLPKIEAENIRDTLLIRIWVRSHQVDLSREILDKTILYIKKDIDEKINIEINNIDSTITQNEIEIERTKKEIDILKKKLRIIDENKKYLTKAMDSTKSRINEIEKEQLGVLKKEEKSEVESLGILLYSNEVHQSLMYYDDLYEKLSEDRLNEEEINSQIQKESANIDRFSATVLNLKERKGRIDFTKIIKKPESSLSPVSPKIRLNMFFAGILGMILFTGFAFLVDYIEKSKTSLP